jgi:hypothetical protein
MKTTRRKENKYIISYMDYQKIKPLIQQLLIHDQHGEDDGYKVHSIYLDDIVFSGASDKAFGNEYHKKYRIRHYNDSDVKKLECKEKSGEDAVKHSTVLSQELYEGILTQNLDVLYDHFSDPLIRRFTLDFTRMYLIPKVSMTYVREAFKDTSDNLRITFDHSLCGERFVDEFEESDFSLISNHLLILEVKYEHYIPKEIKAILDQINLDQVAYSKYYYGYQRAYL